MKDLRILRVCRDCWRENLTCEGRRVDTYLKCLVQPVVLFTRSSCFFCRRIIVPCTYNQLVNHSTQRPLTYLARPSAKGCSVFQIYFYSSRIVPLIPLHLTPFVHLQRSQNLFPEHLKHFFFYFQALGIFSSTDFKITKDFKRLQKDYKKISNYFKRFHEDFKRFKRLSWSQWILFEFLI